MAKMRMAANYEDILSSRLLKKAFNSLSTQWHRCSCLCGRGSVTCGKICGTDSEWRRPLIQNSRAYRAGNAFEFALQLQRGAWFLGLDVDHDVADFRIRL